MEAEVKVDPKPLRYTEDMLNETMEQHEGMAQCIVRLRNYNDTMLGMTPSKEDKTSTSDEPGQIGVMRAQIHKWDDLIKELAFELNRLEQI